MAAGGGNVGIGLAISTKREALAARRVYHFGRSPFDGHYCHEVDDR